MRVDVDDVNSALSSILDNSDPVIFLDANILIAPDRNPHARAFSMDSYFEFIDALFSHFSNLSIHEAVYDESVLSKVKNYIDEKMNTNPVELAVHYYSDLLNTEYLVLSDVSCLV